MKKLFSIIVTLILTINILPIYAQEITISREEVVKNFNEVDGILSKEFNNYVIKNPEAAYKEFRDILKEKSKQYDPNTVKTYRDKQTYRNRAFLPPISIKEKYPNSTNFKKEGDLYRYAIAARNAALETKTPLGYEDFRNHAENEMRRMFLQESKDENVLKEIYLDNKRSPINDASYLASFYAQNLAFTEAVREANLTLHSSDCSSPQSKKDRDCIDAGILGQYNYNLFKEANQNVIKHISTIAPMINNCIVKVLAPLQARKIALQEIDEYLDEHSNLPWSACGVDYEEAKDLILDHVLTRTEAEEIIDNVGFGQKLLGTLDYISFSYYFNRANAIEDFKMGMEDQMEDMSNSEIYREAQISDLLSNSLNKILTQIASNYITYGQVFYYDVEGFSGKSDKFAEGWHAIGTNDFYKDMPIAKLAQNAITRSGRRGYQDKTFAKSLQEVRFESNAKTEVEILLIAADFVMDPTMLLGPIGETVQGLRLASKATKVADKAETAAKVVKTADKVGDVSKLADDAAHTARNAANATKNAETLEETRKLYQQAKGAADFVEDLAGTGRLTDKANDATKLANETIRATDAATDVATDVAKTTPTQSPSATTALSPTELTPKLTGEFDDLLTATGRPITDATTATHLSSKDHRLRAVWKLEDASGNTVGFAKVGSADEVSRTKLVEDILDGDKVTKGGIRQRYKGIEVEYPRIMSENFDQLPQSSQQVINTDLRELESSKNFRNAGTRLQQGFVTSPVDASGVNIGDLRTQQRQWMGLEQDQSVVGKKTRSYLLKQLDYQPVSKAEMEEVESLIRDLNDAGFHHNDLEHNMFLKRDPKTRKLKVTLLDFEPEAGAADAKIVERWKQGLSKYDLITDKPVSKRTIKKIRKEEEQLAKAEIEAAEKAKREAEQARKIAEQERQAKDIEFKKMVEEELERFRKSVQEQANSTPAKSGKTSPVPERRGIGFKPQNNISPSNTTTGAPEGMRRQIGFGNEGNYIPESAGIRDPNGPGVQNVTNATPGQRVPDGPNARNPYDIRNSATGTNSGTSNTPNVHQNEPRAPIKQRNDWVPPETTVQETLDAFDDQIAKLEAERKKMGLFSSREKKAALDREIEKLKGQKDKFFNSISGKTLDTHSPIYDNVILTRKAEVEEYLSKAPTGGPAMTRAQDEYVNLYNAYLSVNVDALHPAQRAEFLKSFDELSGLRFTDAISTGPEGLAYRQKILNLRSSLDGINTSVYHIKFGGAGLGEREMFAHMKSGLRQQHFGAIKDTDPSISLKSLKGEIDKLSGPNGFKEAPLVDFTAHGYLYGNPKKGTPSWHGTFGNGGDNTVAEIVDIFNDGQEYNLYFRNCHGGAAMDDFLALPTNKTKKLNMFTEAGRNQKNAVMLRSQNSSSSLGAAIDNLSYSIERGNIGSRAVINGQHYYPLETAIAQARAEGNTDLVRKLDVYKTLLDTKDPNEFSRAAREYTRLFPGSVAPSSPGFIIATNQAEVVPGKVLYIDKGTAKYVQQVSDGMLGELKGFKKARPVVPQKTNPSVIGLSGPTKKTVNTGGTTRKPILSI